MEEKNHEQMIHSIVSRKAKNWIQTITSNLREFKKIMVTINSKLLFKLRPSINNPK